MTKQKKILFVVGMHRSGTSALAGSLSKLGFDLGQNMMPPNFDNIKGFFENQSITALNEKILRLFSSSWDSLITLPDNWLKDDAIPDFIERGMKIIREEFDFETEHPILIKDPRICLLLPFWIKVLKHFNTLPSLCIILRSPREIALSLKKRNGISLNKGLLLWYRYISKIEVESRFLKRTFVNYNDLLLNPVATLHKCISELEFNLYTTLKKQFNSINTAINPLLKHNKKELFVYALPSTISDKYDKLYNNLCDLTSFAHNQSVLSKIDMITKENNEVLLFHYNEILYQSSSFIRLVLKHNGQVKSIQNKPTHKGRNKLCFTISEDTSYDQVTIKPSNIISCVSIHQILFKYGDKEEIVKPSDIKKINSLIRHQNQYIFDKNNFITFDLRKYHYLNSITYDFTYHSFNQNAIQEINKIGISLRESFFNEHKRCKKELQPLKLKILSKTKEIDQLKDEIQSLKNQLKL